MKKHALGLLLALLLVTFSATAEEMTGYISDATCAKSGKDVSKDEHAACAKKCASGGQALVFVSVSDRPGAVYKVSDQSKIQDYIGHKVTVTGKVDGDTLTVESVKDVS